MTQEIDLSRINAIVDAGLAPDSPHNNTPQKQSFFKPLTFIELLNLPPKEWLVKQILGRRDLVMAYGAPASGKTFVVIDLIFAICLGKTWAGRFEPDKPLNVAYCAGEGVSGLAGRFQAAAEFYGVAQIPNFTFFADVPQLFIDSKSTEATESILQFVVEWKARQDAGEAEPLDVLVIDTFHSATAGADENSAQHAGQVVKVLRAATKVLDCAVVLVHHSNKAGTGERGSSALRGAMDTMIEVKQIGNRFGIECAKLKDGMRWIPQKFELLAKAESARIEWDEPKLPEGKDTSKSKRITEFLEDNSDGKYTAKQLAELVGSTDASARNLLSKLVEKDAIKIELHELEKPPSSKNPWVYFV